MELECSQNSHDTSSKDEFANWPTKADVRDRFGISTCIIGSLFDGLLSFLKAVLHDVKQCRPEPPHYRSLEKSAAALLFWGSDHGVSNGALDKDLQHSSLLRDTVLLVLTSIGDLLSQGFLNVLSVEARANVLRTSNITFLVETARLALKDSDDVFTQPIDNEQDAEELSRLLHEKIESLERLNTSLECPAGSDLDEEDSRANVIIHATKAQFEWMPWDSTSSVVSKAPDINGAFNFITGRTAAVYKSKNNITSIRKKAMDAYLKGDKKANKGFKSPTRTRFSSVDSDSGSSWMPRSSIGSQDAFTDLSTLDGHDQDSPTMNSLVARTQQVHNFALPLAPIVLPCAKGIPSAYDTYTPPPFVSMGKSLNPFRTVFKSEFSHAGVSIEELKFHGARYFGTRALGRHWIPTALGYPHTFLGTLCITTSYHDVIHERQLESVQTIALRQEVIHLVGRNMLDSEARVSDHNIMAVIQLIISEVIGREESGLVWHENGIENMIKQRGGLDKLGVNGQLASAISWVSLATAVLREASPRPIYTDYCAANSTRHYRPTATIPESPVYCPRPNWSTIPGSTKCMPKALELLGDMRTMIDIFLHEPNLTTTLTPSRRNSSILMNLYKKITGPTEYPPIAEIRKSRVLTQHDYKYEAIRLVSVMQATAIAQKEHLSDALAHALDVQLAPVWCSSLTDTISNDSSVQLYATTQDMIASEPSKPSSSSTHDTSPKLSRAYFPIDDPRSSSSTSTEPGPFSHKTSATRPSSLSTQPASSDHVYFPAPPAPASRNTTMLLKDLRNAIESSNISECWSEMAGVLLWIGLVAGAASRKSESKIHKKYFSALTIRVGVMLCFEHPEAINSTMMRMCEVVKALGVEKERAPSRDDGKGKRRMA